MDKEDKPAVVVVAIACAPYGGSEGKVGWEGVLAISTFARVRVLTSGHNRSSWEKARTEGLVPHGVSVQFLGTDRDWHSNRLVARGQSWQRYLAFMREVKRILPQLIQNHRPDLIHHLTYATWRVPSIVWQFGIPSIWGPIGGSGEIPKAFRPSLSKATRFLETIRRWHTGKVARSRKFRGAMEKTSLVIAANQETRDLLAPYRKDKPLQVLPVAYLSGEKIRKFRQSATRRSDQSASSEGLPLRLFAGGNIEGRKGVAFALKALARVKAEGVRFHYTVAGGGPDIANLKTLMESLGLAEDVTFHPGYRGDEYIEQLGKTDIFLLPSFRETLGMTCQEAILCGCYPVVADISAQGEMSRIAGITGASVASEEALVSEMATSILEFAREPTRMRQKAEEGSIKLAELFSEERYIKTLREGYSSIIEASSR